MKGLYVRRSTECLEAAPQQIANLRLLAKGGNAEIMVQQIKPSNTFFVEPGQQQDLMEFFYILDGQVEYEENKERTVLTPGDYFYAHHLARTVRFRALTHVTLLYFSTQPVFHYLSKSISELRQIAEESRKKDLYTHNHGERVMTYSVAIATKLRLSNETIENIGFASLFHDVGKVNIPDEILQKPGRLTTEEMAYVKAHPADGVARVKTTYYQHIADIIAQHHERLDGSGYPAGLKGDDILIEAKIIAVADSYDAMTTDRPYRKAMTPKAALAELKSLCLVHYEERVVNAFEEYLIEQRVIQ